MKEIKITQTITPRDSESLSRYFQDINKTQPLTPDEEADLAIRIRRGDLKARNQLVNANLRFVVSIAKQYRNMGIALDDLINEGNIGLIHAAEKFDPTYGFKFDTFAVWWIRQSIMNALAEDLRMVHLPMNVVGMIASLRKAINQFEIENQRPPTTEELAALTDIDEKRVRELMHQTPSVSSLDASVNNETETTMGEMLPDTETNHTDAALTHESLQHDISRLLHRLPHREAEILRKCFGIGDNERNLDTIAIEMDLSRERVRQIREQALAHLRQLHPEALKQYL